MWGADGTNGSWGVGPLCQCDAGLVLSYRGYQAEKLLVRFQLRGLQNSLVSKQHGTWVDLFSNLHHINACHF